MYNQEETLKKSGFHYSWVVLMAMCGIMIGSMGTVSSSMGVFTPSVVADLNVPVTAVAIYFSIRTLCMAFFQPIAGRIFVKFDVRIIIGVAIVLCNGGMMMLSLFHHIWGWYISAVISGIGLSFICYLLIPIILSNWFKKNLGTAIGVAAAFTGVGGAIFSTVTGDCIAAYGFRMTYVIVGGVGMLISLLCMLMLRTKPEDKGLQPYGFGDSQEGKDKVNAMDKKGLSFKEAFKTPYIYVILIIVFCVYFAASFMTDIVNYSVNKGFDIALAGKISSAMMIGIILGKITLGWINDHVGARWTVFTAAIFGLVAFALFINAGRDPYFVFIGAFVFGGCVGSMSVTPPLIVKRSFGQLEYAKIYSVAATIGVLTSTIAHPIYGLVFDVTGTYDAVMIAAAIALVVSVILAWMVIEKSNKLWDK